MKQASFLIASAVIAMAPCTLAQTAKKQHPPVAANAVIQPTGQPAIWAAEPDAILGLRLGQPIEDSKLPMCPRPGYETTICLDPRANGTFVTYALRGHPFTYAAASIGIDSEGVVSSLTMTMPQENFGDFARVLKERYGSPSSSSIEAVQSKAGATFMTQSLSWSGVRMHILALERNDRVDQSTVIFGDNAAMARSASKRDAKTKADASKL